VADLKAIAVILSPYRSALILTGWFVLGLIVLMLSGADVVFAQYDDAQFQDICNRALSYVEGGFGALLASIAGVGAIVASAAGGFRLAWALIVVSIGAYILREYIGLFFTGSC